ncbi:hypothetical protein CAEBREN_24070 [Caenorhabditis brenneri]|uniref:Uncharacterized protein n=1 Tax=Caenorhabditis brenneri TaxID=135651 RepID=G0MN95_CAEBE|nr:hypothetical protein CAEBREN_24070 [Caenorhabditis brenneri]
MRTPKEKSKCSICLEEGDGYHFGAEACKACAAFFRRSVTQKKSYQCRGNDDCDITINIRCMCRACRFTKCIEMGMNPAGVQQRQEPPKPQDLPDLQTPLNTPSTSSSPGIPHHDHMPMLTRMQQNYQKLLNARQIIHKEDGENLFEERVPRQITYLESIKQGMKDVTLGADWISWCYEDFVRLPVDQKNALFRNFYVAHFVLEEAFMSHTKNTPDRVNFPSGDYIDINELEKFYKNEGEEQPMTKEQIDELFKPSFIASQKRLILPMMSENVDVFEFFALTTFLLWDTGLENLTDETIKIGKSVINQVIKELTFYMRNIKKIDEPSIRIASIVSLLPAVQKSTRRIQDDLEITKVFKIYTASQEFYDLIDGNFC